MEAEDIVSLIMTWEANQQAERIKQQSRELQKKTDFESEIAQQASNKAEKEKSSIYQNPNELRAKADSTGAKGSTLSRLQTAKMIIGTPNSDMGTGGESLGSFHKKELI